MKFNKKKVYLKKYEEIGGFTVWIVNGNYIRRNICIEFTNFAHHHIFPFILKDEFWIDKEYSHKEMKYYVTNMLVTYRMMAEGKSYDKAIEKADRVEKSERMKSKLMQRIKLKKIKHSTELIKKIHKELLDKYSKKIKVWIINGELVRDLFFLDFTEGGHDKVYHFVPDNEIWLDDDNTMRERKFILLHEMHERNLMAKGWNYEKAHSSSSHIEHICRRNPRLLEKHLKEEIERQERG